MSISSREHHLTRCSCVQNTDLRLEIPGNVYRSALREDERLHTMPTAPCTGVLKGSTVPTYVYRGLETGVIFEVEQRMIEAPLTHHPETGEPVSRMIQATGIVFKGSGFYKTDSRSSSGSASKPAADASKAPDSSESKSSSASESAPTSPSEPKASSTTESKPSSPSESKSSNKAD
jgi:predicted nucleic acid-binding Zn ribbon protein